MTMMKPHRSPSAPGVEELRRHVTGARKGLGRTVGALASRAAHAAAKAQGSARDKDGVARLTAAMRDGAAHPRRLLRGTDRSPLRAGAGRVVRTARTHRTAVMTAAGVLTAAVLARRSRRASVRGAGR
ncbi:hypothetical protein ACN6AT_01880 [Streptomyces sp. JL4002]|uniref:hypothetical protein n=1 Tax=Streptomyces TaxID=1883 RepID=UPI0033FB9D5E